MTFKLQTDSPTVNLIAECNSKSRIEPDDNENRNRDVLLIPSDTESETAEKVTLTDELDITFSQILFRNVIASLTNRYLTLRQVRECGTAFWLNMRADVMMGNYYHQRWRDYHGEGVTACVYQKMAIPSDLRDSYVDIFHATHTVKQELPQLWSGRGDFTSIDPSLKKPKNLFHNW